MKLRYLFAAIASSLCLLAACTQEEPVSLDTIQLDKTYLSIPAEGGSVTLHINATEAWAFAKNIKVKDELVQLPDWLTASPVAGGPGETVVTFTAERCEYGREQAFRIEVGNQYQYFFVRQGEMASVDATCQDVVDGPDGKTYTVTGVCTSIANTQYGNWYLNDGTNEIYIYGTLDKDGKTKNFLSLGIEVGDVITVQGPKTTYGTTVELVDVTVLKIAKSLLKVDKTEFKDLDKDGAEFTLKAAFKGNGAYVKECPDWISLASTEYVPGVPSKLEPNPADTSKMTFRVAPNEGVTPREGIIKVASTAGKNNSDIDVVVSQKPNAPALMTIAEALNTDYTHVKGTVMAICNRGYVLADETAAILCYYGSKFDATKYKKGDVIEIVNATGHYNFGAQLSCDGKEGFDLEEKISDGTGEVTYPTPKVMDQEALAALIASVSGKTSSLANCIPMEYVQIVGTPVKSGNYVNIFLDDYTAADFSAYQLPASFDLNAMLDKKVTIRGYTQSVSSNKHVNIVFTELIEGEADVPTIQYTDLSAINALAAGANFELTAIVAYITPKEDAAIVTDGTNHFYLYKPAPMPKVGDIVTATGTISIYNKLIESAQGPAVTVVQAGTLPELTPVDITSTYGTFLNTNQPTQLISATGKYVVDGTYTNLVVGENTVKGSLSGALDAAYDGKNVKVTGWFTGSNKTSTFIYTAVTKVEEL